MRVNLRLFLAIAGCGLAELVLQRVLGVYMDLGYRIAHFIGCRGLPESSQGVIVGWVVNLSVGMLGGLAFGRWLSSNTLVSSLAAALVAYGVAAALGWASIQSFGGGHIPWFIYVRWLGTTVLPLAAGTALGTVVRRAAFHGS